MFFDLTSFKYIFHIKIQLFVTLKSYQDPDSGSAMVRLPGSSSEIRKIKSWIWIWNRTETNADPLIFLSIIFLGSADHLCSLVNSGAQLNAFSPRFFYCRVYTKGVKHETQKIYFVVGTRRGILISF
jgi:hypothetical protein